MKHTRLSFFMILLLLLFVSTSCSNDDEDPIKTGDTQIVHSDILGMYEIVDSQSSTEFDGDLWDIRVKNINMACTHLKPYTFEKETLKVDDKSYTFVKNEDDFTVTTSDNKTFTLIKTNKNCDDIIDPVYLKIEDIIGHYKIVEAYSYISGEPQKPNSQLVGQIWDITEEEVNVNCSLEAISYTFEENRMTVGDIEYQIEKNNPEESKLIVSYIFNDVIYDLYLEETTEVCPEEEKPQVGDVELDKMYGYAAFSGTTGGEGATKENIHHFDDGYKFTAWLKAREKNKSAVPAIVWLSGEFVNGQGRDKSTAWFDIKDTQNLTIYGTNDFRMKNIGFFLVRTENIIIRNVYIEMPKADKGADGISMQKSKRIWVDHCTFESMNQIKDYEDGSVDITHQSQDVTVSWNHFIKTQKSCLVGHSSNEVEDKDITATFHHNFFDQSSSRHPRVRFGNVHVFNNFFNAVTTYGVGSAMEAKVLVESNYFDNVQLPIDIATFPAKPKGSSWVSNLTDKTAGYIYESDNTYANKPSNALEFYPFINLEFKVYEGDKLSTPLAQADFKPPYEYIVDRSEEVNTIVSNGAGVGKLENFANAPLEVDNGGITEEPGGDDKDPEEGEEGNEGVDLGNSWIALELGNSSNVGGIFSIENDVLTLIGGGKTESKGHEGYFVYREIEGDFIVTVKLHSYNGSRSNNQGFAGIMFVEDISVPAGELIMAASGKAADGSYNQYSRVTTGSSSRNALTAPDTSGDNLYLMLRREGNTFYSSYSLDGGVTYGKERKQDKFTEVSQKGYLGLSVNSSEAKKVGTAVFSDVKINGESIDFSND
ncbi:MAG: hypothetical protein GX963_11680 [Bacteroidales bacterium]|nr:hypothetical protein [Bacteroidales bacterium]